MKIHYVYRITNTTLNKHYIGVRSCEGLPINDLGIKYFSSSMDKEFKEDQKVNPQNYRYKVIRILPNREEAVNLEIKLHNKFDVGRNNNFYNRAKQTSVGFETYSKDGKDNPFYGRKHTEEAKGIIGSKSKGRVKSIRTRKLLSDKLKGKLNPMYGKTHTEKSISRMKNKLRSRDFSGANNPRARKVRKLTLDGLLIATYSTAIEALASLNIEAISSSGISQCCTGKQETYKGFRWQYA